MKHCYTVILLFLNAQSAFAVPQAGRARRIKLLSNSVVSHQQKLNALRAQAAAIAALPTTPSDMRKDLADSVSPALTVLNAGSAELRRKAKEQHQSQVVADQQHAARHAFLVAAAQNLPRLKQQLITSQQQYQALLQEQLASQALLPELVAFQGHLVMHLITSPEMQSVLQAQQVPPGNCH